MMRLIWDHCFSCCCGLDVPLRSGTTRGLGRLVVLAGSIVHVISIDCNFGNPHFLFVIGMHLLVSSCFLSRVASLGSFWPLVCHAFGVGLRLSVGMLVGGPLSCGFCLLLAWLMRFGRVLTFLVVSHLVPLPLIRWLSFLLILLTGSFLPPFPLTCHFMCSVILMLFWSFGGAVAPRRCFCLLPMGVSL